MREMKDSGIEWIGEIPADWTLQRGKTIFAQRLTKGNQSEILLAATQKYGMLPQSEVEGVVQVKEDADLQQFRTVHKKDFVISLRSFQGGFEYSQYEGVCSPAYQVFYNTNPICHNYYRLLFKSDGFIQKMNSMTVGIREGKNIQYSDFADSLIPVPPIDQQQRIADYLDRKCSQIDTIIARQQEVIEKLKAYKLSVITEAVTKGLNPDVPMKNSGVEWIGKIPEHWAIHKFCWDYSAMLGKMLDAKRITGEHLHPYIKNADVQWDSINFEDLDEMDFSDEEKERYTISPGDLMVCEGGEIGKCAIVPDDIPEDIYYQKALHRVRKRHPDSGNIHFLCKVIYCMAKNNCLNTSPEKATIAHLPGDALSQLRIPTPPISEQGQIAEYLNDKCMEIDRFSARKHETIDKLIEYKKSLIYEVVTGKKEV